MDSNLQLCVPRQKTSTSYLPLSILSGPMSGPTATVSTPASTSYQVPYHNTRTRMLKSRFFFYCSVYGVL